MNEQQETPKPINRAVIAFFEERGIGKRFSLGELQNFIRATVGKAAPGSPDRVLRDLRQRGLLDYALVSRRDSLYEVLSVGKTEPDEERRSSNLEALTEERIGGYRVHPVASMFPLLHGEEYGKLRSSISSVGQIHSIVVKDGVLLDGRTRLNVCLELGVEPRVEEYDGKLDPVDYILAANIERRHMEEDARVALCAQAQLWRIARDNALKQIEAGAAQGHHGAEGGRGHKKPLRQDSDEGVSKRDYAAENANSTAGQIAAQAKVSRHKAEQAVTVAKHAPELLGQVKSGEMKLKDAAVHAKANPAAKPTREDLYDFTRRIAAELTRRRKEAHDNTTGRWNVDRIAKLDLHNILNWVQQELDAFNSGQSAIRREKADRPPRPTGQGEKDGTQSEFGIGPVN